MVTTARWAVAAAACGLMGALAFEPVSFRPGMVIGIAGILLVLRHTPDDRWHFTALLGACYGLGLMAPLVWWMNAVSHGAYVGIVVSQLPFFAVLTVCLRRVMRRVAWPLWGAALWVGVEVLRSNFPFSGFPWGRLAYTGVGTPFESYARLFGISGMSALMFLLSAAIATLIDRRGLRTTFACMMTIAGILICGTLLPMGIAGPQGTTRVALIQGGVPGVAGQWPPGEIFDKHVAETQDLIDDIGSGNRPQPDFVLWPENSTDLDPAQSPRIATMLDELVSGLKAPILVGALENGPDYGTAYNAGVVWDARGRGETYLKRKPVPYGEYVPFRRILGGVVPRFDRAVPRDILPGHDPGALRIAGVTIGDFICWDVAFDQLARENIDHGAQVLVVQTSNASFTGTAQPQQQWAIARLRAIETGRYVLVPSTNGISGVLDPQGHAVVRTRTQSPAILSATVRLGTGVTAGMRYGERIEAGLVALGVFAVLIGLGREKPRTRSRPGPWNSSPSEASTRLG